mgnify:FL=1
MKTAQLIAWIGVIAMTLAIGNGFIVGDFGADGAELLANPWGIVSLVDLYVGFALFSLWIAFREGNRLMAGVWIILMMTLGFSTGALYVLIALYQCKGDWVTLFLKDRRQKVLEAYQKGKG